MAITDINISEQLETSAPSIKYRGNEGPKSPQEQMQMAGSDRYFKILEFMINELESELGRELTSEEYDEVGRRAYDELNNQSGGQPLPQDPTKPVNPFAPKPTGPVLPDRQMAAYGGIMGLDGRRQYGLGSSLKKRIRKIIPNEVARVAEVAAPFVAPFNPLLAAGMAGVGGFDRTGKIGSSLKSGLMTYGLGQGARFLGGASQQKFQNPFTRDAFSMPTGTGGIKEFLKTKAPADVSKVTEVDKIIPTGQGDYSIFGEKIKEAGSGGVKGLTDKIKDFAMDNKLLTAFLAKEGFDALGGPKQTVSETMDRGEKLDIEGIRTEVIEAMKDPSGEALAALRVKYPFLGRRDTKDIANMAMGGRIGYNDGGSVITLMDGTKVQIPAGSYNSSGGLKDRIYSSSKGDLLREEIVRKLSFANGGRIGRAEGGIMDLGGMEKDYRAEGGFVPIGREEKADDVPARLSVNEFVFTADAVRNAGGGDIDRGAEVMENMMKHLEQGGQVSDESQGMAGAQQMFETSERLSEVI